MAISVELCLHAYVQRDAVLLFMYGRCISAVLLNDCTMSLLRCPLIYIAILSL